MRSSFLSRRQLAHFAWPWGSSPALFLNTPAHLPCLPLPSTQPSVDLRPKRATASSRWPLWGLRGHLWRGWWPFSSPARTCLLGANSFFPKPPGSEPSGRQLWAPGSRTLSLLPLSLVRSTFRDRVLGPLPSFWKGHQLLFSAGCGVWAHRAPLLGWRMVVLGMLLCLLPTS